MLRIVYYFYPYICLLGRPSSPGCAWAAVNGGNNYSVRVLPSFDLLQKIHPKDMHTAAAAWKSRSWYTSSGMYIRGGGVRQDWEASSHTTLMRRICPMFNRRPTRPTRL